MRVRSIFPLCSALSVYILSRGRYRGTPSKLHALPPTPTLCVALTHALVVAPANCTAQTVKIDLLKQKVLQ